MALAALLATSAHATLADALKGEYRTPTDAEIAANPALKDHMILDVTSASGYGLDNVEQLKSTLGSERAAREKAEGELAPFKELKAKPDDLKAKLEKLGTLEALDPDKEADKIAEQKVAGIKQQLVDQHNTEKSGWEEREKSLLSVVDDAKRTQAATQAILAAGGNPDVLLPHVLGQTKLVEKDGNFDVQVVDAKGNPRIGDASGGAMNLTQLVEEFKGKDAFAPLFEASGTTGGGGKGGQGGGGNPPNTAVRTKADLKDLNARAEYIDKHGQEAYLALPSAPAAAA